jgi:hypothetical protein
VQQRANRPSPVQGPARVKRCGKSAPRRWQHATARQTPPGARPNREAAVTFNGAGSADPRALPGRPLEVRGDADPRGMIALDRTRLTGRLSLRAARGTQRGSPRSDSRTHTRRCTMSQFIGTRRRLITTAGCAGLTLAVAGCGHGKEPEVTANDRARIGARTAARPSPHRPHRCEGRRQLYLTTLSCGRREPPSSVCGGCRGGSGPRSCSENTIPSPVSRA